jgi:hypothetical protein
MRSQKPRRPPRSGRKQALFWAVYLGLLGGVPYSVAVAWRTQNLYADVKGARMGVIGKLYRFDPELGFASIPGAQGYWRVTPGLEVPVRYDENGLRVPVGVPVGAPGRRPRVLALGCSYTVGASCRAEQTYPYLVASALGGEAENAAEGGYGLAQMVVRGRGLIPRLKPDYVLAQCSDWLVSRSQTQTAPSLIGRVPTPYYYQADDGRVLLHPPVFSTRLFDLPVWRYANPRRGASEFLSFLWQVGLPLTVDEDLTFSAKRIRELAGRVPVPCKDGDAIVRAAYTELATLARANGARLVVVIVGKVTGEKRRAWLERLPGVVLVDAEAALWSQLGIAAEGPRAPGQAAYLKTYGHWFGSPPVLVDWHPNARAHAVVAGEVVRVLRESLDGSGRDARHGGEGPAT